MTDKQLADVVAKAVAAALAEAQAPAPTKAKATRKAKAKDTRTWAQVAFDTYYAEKREVSRGKQGAAKHQARAALRKAWGFHKDETAEQFVARCF